MRGKSSHDIQSGITRKLFQKKSINIFLWGWEADAPCGDITFLFHGHFFGEKDANKKLH